ncbi:Putative DNA glycosylase [[Torrubiella] hemipterigena]|uniref:Putative DNA glycosylase n=1 Tax=[Torrubiella] hemipterigena TaxID=1531966 RepID=A0A0A1TNF4_9HYPO|nr:Putative DNA glycosylase [[Torrubiella] hemipterigena]
MRRLAQSLSQYLPGFATRPRVATTDSPSTSTASEMSTRRSSRLSAGAQTEQAAAPAPSSTKPAPARKRKAVDAPAVTNGVPTTPTKKKSKATVAHTPDEKKLTTGAANVASEAAPVAANPAVARLADPRYTNAMLVSPETSRIVSRNVKPLPPINLSKKSAGKGKAQEPQSTTTTQTLLQEACDYLIKVDERMRPLIAKHTCRVFSPEGLAEKIDPFDSLCSGIISQQVSGAAAKSIKAKFIALFNNEGERFPHPSEVVPMSVETLRTAGLSQRKAEYIQGLAEKFVSGELTAQMLQDADYEEVLEKLIAVRGLGKWSVEMFACFALKRMDVFSTGDLGVQRGMAAFMGRDVAKLKGKGGKWKYMSEQEMVEISDRFKPYRTLFMWYMWRVEETDISTMEK